LKLEYFHDNDRHSKALGFELYWSKVNPMFVRKHLHKRSITVYIHLGSHMWNWILYFGKIDKTQ
jgi:hypothetical protein